MKIAYVMADSYHEYNTSNFRCVIPANAINKLPEHEAYVVHINDFEGQVINSNFVCQKSDVIVVERNFKGDILKLVTEWRNKGKMKR